MNLHTDSLCFIVMTLWAFQKSPFLDSRKAALLRTEWVLFILRSCLAVKEL